MKRDYLYIGIIVVLIAYAFGIMYVSQNREDKLIQSLTTYSDSAKYYKLENNAIVATNKAVEIRTQDQMKILAKQMNDTLYAMMKKFKKTQSIMYATNNFYASSDTILHDTIPCDFAPVSVKKSDSTYALKGTVTKNFFSVDSLYVPNKINIVIGEKKTGLFKKEMTVDINNSNPLMKTSNIKAFTYSPEKRWYEKPAIPFAVGVVVAVAVNILKTNLIR